MNVHSVPFPLDKTKKRIHLEHLHQTIIQSYFILTFSNYSRQLFIYSIQVICIMGQKSNLILQGQMSNNYISNQKQTSRIMIMYQLLLQILINPKLGICNQIIAFKTIFAKLINKNPTERGHTRKQDKFQRKSLPSDKQRQFEILHDLDVYYFILIDMNNIRKVNDFQKNAQIKLNTEIYAYFSSGADEEITLQQNVTAFKRLNLLTKQLTGIIQPETRTTILGKNVELPFGFAPCAMHKLAHPKGESITASIANSENLCFTLSTLSTTSLKQIQQCNKNGVRLLQLYILKDRKVTQLMVRLAQKYGFSGIVVTVDAQVIGKRIKDQRNKFISPNSIKLQIVDEIHSQMKSRSSDQYQRRYLTQQRDLSLDWNFIAWLKSITKLPVIIKGILSVEDAILSCQYNVDAIWVSNHGGRQLDCVSATIDILPEIVKAVKLKYPKVQVYIDGGVRRGSDVFKCLALGADYVFLGRPVVYSLVQGQQGLQKMVQILRQELQIQMKEAKISTIEDVKKQSCNIALLGAKL